MCMITGANCHKISEIEPYSNNWIRHPVTQGMISVSVREFDKHQVTSAINVSELGTNIISHIHRQSMYDDPDMIALILLGLTVSVYSTKSQSVSKMAGDKMYQRLTL